MEKDYYFSLTNLWKFDLFIPSVIEIYYMI